MLLYGHGERPSLSNIQELFQKGRILLQDLPQPSLEAKVLLLKSVSLAEEQFPSSLAEVRFFSSPEKKLSRKEERQFFKLVSKRRLGIPLAYLTGIKEFWSIPFRVSSGIFIPRPETELIIEKVLELTSRLNSGKTIVDIGTGCGNIAISLAKELPQAQIIATDISQKALKIAKLNAARQNISSVSFARGRLFNPLKKLGLEKNCDFIVSNPPYVSEEEWMRLQPEIKNHESKRAVVAGQRGLEFIQRLIQGSPRFLKAGGYLVFEIGEGQKDTVFSLFGLEWTEVKCYDDLNQVPRIVVGRKS